MFTRKNKTYESKSFNDIQEQIEREKDRFFWMMQGLH